MCTMKPLHVVLVADPASPTRVARRIKDLDPPKGEHHGAWDVEVVSESFTTASEDADTALARLDSQAHQHEWDIVVGLTELPLRDDDGRYLLVEAAPPTADRRAVTACARRSAHCTHALAAQCAHSSAAWPTPPRRTNTTSRSPPRGPLATARGDGARQPALAPRARPQVRARRGTGDRRHRDDELCGPATGRGPVGPPLQHLDHGHSHRWRSQLLCGALPREPRVGAVCPRPLRDRSPSAMATSSCSPGSWPRRRPSAGASAVAWSRTRRYAQPRTRSARRSVAAVSRGNEPRPQQGST